MKNDNDLNSNFTEGVVAGNLYIFVKSGNIVLAIANIDAAGDQWLVQRTHGDSAGKRMICNASSLLDFPRAVDAGFEIPASKQRILHLTLNRQWFEMIFVGMKREEYREIKPHWESRLRNQEYDAVNFRNGYDPKCPSMLVECAGITIGRGNPNWGFAGKECFKLGVGPLLGFKNIPKPWIEALVNNACA